MESFNDLRKKLTIDMNKVIHKIMTYSDVQDYIIYLNQEVQLNSGIDAKGQFIRTISSEEQSNSLPYSKYTVQIKKDKGQQTNAVNLKDTGEFWNTFKVNVNDNDVEVIADFSKGGDDIRDNFDSKYDFLGLNDESLKLFGEWLNYYLERDIRDYFQL